MNISTTLLAMELKCMLTSLNIQSGTRAYLKYRYQSTILQSVRCTHVSAQFIHRAQTSDEESLNMSVGMQSFGKEE